MSSITPSQSNLSIEETLAELRQLILRYLSLRGLTLAGIGFILFFWVTGFLDYFPVWLGAQDSPKLVRVIFLVLGGAGLGYLLWTYLLRPLAVRWTDRAIALLIERKYPQINSSLITYVENRNLPAQRATSDLAKHWHIENDPQLQHQIALQAKDSVSAVDIHDIMRWKPLQYQCGVFGALMALSFLGFAAMPSWSVLWGKRLFLLSNEVWPRQSSIRADHLEIEIPNFSGELERKTYAIPFESHRITVPFDQSARLFASASLDKAVVPTTCTINYSTSDGQSGRANMRRMPENRRDRRQPFMLDGSPLERIKQNVSFSLRGGDSRVSDLQIETVPAVVLADVKLDVKYPEYLRRRQASAYLDGMQPYRNGIRLPEGVQVTMRVTANTPLSRCEYQLVSQSDTTAERSTGTIDIHDGNQFDLPLGQLRKNMLVEFRAWDANGHCAISVGQYVLSIVEDQLPSAEMVLEGIGTSVTPLARIPFKIVAKDDHDIKDTSAKLVLTDKPPINTPIPFAADGVMTGEIDLRDLQDQSIIELKPSEVLVLYAQVDDYFDLSSASRSVNSNSIPLSVVTVEEMLILLDRRELELRHRLEQIVVELEKNTILLSKSLEEQPAATPAPDQAKPEDDMSGNRMNLVRIQEGKIQSEKSSNEVSGIVAQLASIVAELINNRIDSSDRQSRLEGKIREPLRAVVDGDLQTLITELKAIEVDLRDSKFDLERAKRSRDLNFQIVEKLKDVLKSMIEVQDFNQLVEQIRDAMQTQERLRDKTKEEQKKRALDLFQ